MKDVIALKRVNSVGRIDWIKAYRTNSQQLLGVIINTHGYRSKDREEGR
jgi:hypothetical protein